MIYNFSNRVTKIKPSFTLEMATIAAEMNSQGIDIVNFSVGEPDFNTPSHIIKAGKIAMEKGYTNTAFCDETSLALSYSTSLQNHALLSNIAAIFVLSYSISLHKPML